MFRFAHPEYLYLLTLVPVFIMFFIYILIIKNKRLKRFGNKVILKQLMPDVSHWRPRIKFYILLSAMALTIFIVAGPQFGTKLEKEKRQYAVSLSRPTTTAENESTCTFRQSLANIPINLCPLHNALPILRVSPPPSPRLS